jgi:hypothetical protein
MKTVPSFNSFKKADPNDNGLNNAAILTFSKDVLDALVKELTQNSIDALAIRGSKLKIRIRMESIFKKEIPNIEQIDSILDKMIVYWHRQKDFVNFFNDAKQILQADSLHTFIFEDFNTKGLLGDCNSGTFKSLLLDEGVSDKDHKNSLGGFGIGKNAFFAFTGLQTVFYSSYNQEGCKFMGVTKLAEYKDENDFKRNNRIYYGQWEKALPDQTSDLGCIYDEDLIPEFFKRNENGLSSFAIGVHNSDQWQTHTKQALIRNYWFLFENDLLEAEIDGETINNSNYFNEAEKIFIEDMSILSYIKTFKDPQVNVKENIVHIDNINILLREASPGENYPNRIVIIRDGMMIKEVFPGVSGLPNNISGIIYCDNPNGNEILGKMEPPAHNDFVPYLLPKKSNLTENDGALIIRQIDNAKKKCVRLIKDQYNEPSSSVALIDELMSGFSDSISKGIGKGNAVISKDETFEIVKKEKEFELKFNSSEKTAVIRGNGQGKDEGGGGGGSSRGGSGGSSKKGKRKKRNQALIKTSIFFSKSVGKTNQYKMIVYSDKDIDNANISFSQYGDSGASSMSSVLLSVKDTAGSYHFRSDGSVYVIEGIMLKNNIRNVFDLEFEETEQSAFKFNN